MRTDTKNNVGISCRTRWPRKFSMARSSYSPRSLQFQSDHSHKPVRRLPVALKLGGMRDQELGMIKIDQRLVVQNDLGQFLVDRHALRLVVHEAGVFKRFIGFRVGIAAVIL